MASNLKRKLVNHEQILMAKSIQLYNLLDGQMFKIFLKVEFSITKSNDNEIIIKWNGIIFENNS